MKFIDISRFIIVDIFKTEYKIIRLFHKLYLHKSIKLQLLLFILLNWDEIGRKYLDWRDKIIKSHSTIKDFWIRGETLCNICQIYRHDTSLMINEGYICSRIIYGISVFKLSKRLSLYTGLLDKRHDKISFCLKI